MGQRRRYRRQQERLRTQGAASTSDVGATDPNVEAASQPVPWILRPSTFTATTIGGVLGFFAGGPVGAAILGGIGAAVDWVRR